MSVFKASLIGIGVCFLCLLPPILHLITGPLSPLIGGIVAGVRAQARGTAALTIGLTIAAGFGVIVGLAGGLAVLVMGNGGTPVAPGLFVGIEAGVVSYAFVLASLGALAGGRLAR
jgi:hypothetical protein